LAPGQQQSPKYLSIKTATATVATRKKAVKTAIQAMKTMTEPSQ
jgi:hypothetical protein